MIFTAKEQIVEQMKKNLVAAENADEKVKAHARQVRVNALLRIFENQTRDEQRTESTNHYNGIGFTGSDARFLTSLAKQYKFKGYLSPKQDAYLERKIKKYARQLVECSIAEGKIKTYGKYYYTNDYDLKVIKEM